MIVLFDVRTGKRLAEIGDELDAVLAADRSPDQSLVALGDSGRVVKVYATVDGTLSYRITNTPIGLPPLPSAPMAPSSPRQIDRAAFLFGMHDRVESS